jgi:hypothetical protein
MVKPLSAFCLLLKKTRCRASAFLKTYESSNNKVRTMFYKYTICMHVTVPFVCHTHKLNVDKMAIFDCL